MTKLTFVQAEHPRMLSYISCQSVREEEPEKEPIDLDDLVGKAYFGICMVFMAFMTGALVALL
jgi:hypothetical protein